MRVIKSDTGILAYQKIFKQIKSHHSPVVIWQVSPETGERQVLESRLTSFHLESGLIHFELPKGKTLSKDSLVFVYVEDGPLIFKSALKDLSDLALSLEIPAEIKLLEDPEAVEVKKNIGQEVSTVWKTKRVPIDVDKSLDIMRVKRMAQRTSRDQTYLNQEFNLSLDEEDRIFADKRESPRARPKVQKSVKVQVSGDDNVYSLKLFDLSQGGIGFICGKPEIFPKGTEIQVVGFEDFNLDDPLIAEVMSLRPLDSKGIEFKIGCKFAEGQD